MKRIILATLGLLFGIWLTWLAFRDTDWPAIYRLVQSSSLSWLVVSAFFFGGAHVVRAYRWSILLKQTIPPVSFRKILSSVMIGALAQTSLPLKAGLFFRSVAFARITGMSVSKIYGSATLDRVPELMILGVFVIFAMVSLPAVDTYVIQPDVFGTEEPIEFPGAMMQSVVVLITGAVTIRLGLLIGLYLRRDIFIGAITGIINRFSQATSARIEAILNQFADALDVLKSRVAIAQCMAWTLVFWLMFMGGHAAVFQALGIDWDWRAPLFSVLLTAVSMGLPGAPGFVGGWHLAVVMALVITAPGLDGSEMKAAGILTHVIGVGVAAAMGVVSLVTQPIGVTDLASDADIVAKN